LERAADATRDRTPDDTDEAPPPESSIASRSTTIDGQQVDLAEPRTSISFEDDAGLLSGQYGQPRPREFWQAKQVGQTPPMELLKNAVKRQLIGGEPKAVADDELRGPEADFADLVTDIYDGQHFQDKSLDNLIVDAVDDLIDTGWAYWELLPSANGEFPVAGFKPLPPLQIQHNIKEDAGGDLADDPAYYQVPYTRTGTGSVRMGDEATPLERSQVVAMRDPLASGSDSLYGQSLATKVREWLELIIDVDVHEKRHYSDSQLPSGFLHFLGAVDDDKLGEIEQDIVEASGDPHELVTTTSEEDAKWIPVGDAVADLEAIEQQKWYFKLVFAAAGLNLNELGMIEGSGFAKETPALARQVFKNVTKPFMGAIFDPQNNDVVDTIAGEFSGIDSAPFRLTLERFDPVQEQIEREETLKEWQQGAVSLNEIRGELGREAEEVMVEIDGQEYDVASLPKYVVTLLMKRDRPEVNVDGDGDDEGMAGVV
jgi:hypothetical protein